MIRHIKIKKITVVIGNGETIYFEPELPSPFPKMGYEATLKMEVASGHGVAYVREHFGRDPDEVIQMRGNRT